MKRLGCVVLMAALLAGCSALEKTSVLESERLITGGFRITEADAGSHDLLKKSDPQSGFHRESLVIDATQRLIMVAPPRRDDPYQAAIVCAEPTPDAISAVSGSLAAAIGGDNTSGTTKGDASFAAGVSEAVTQLSKGYSVQLLRDGLFRACEMYMNGVLDRAEYVHLANKYADASVVLLAMEQMGGGTSHPLSFGVSSATPVDLQRRSASTGADGQQNQQTGRADVGQNDAALVETFNELIQTKIGGVDGATATAMADVVKEYFKHSAEFRKQSLKSKCLSYFEYPGKTRADMSDDYYVRKAMLTLMCADQFEHLETIFDAEGDLGRNLSVVTAKVMETLILNALFGGEGNGDGTGMNLKPASHFRQQFYETDRTTDVRANANGDPQDATGGIGGPNMAE